MSGGPIPPGAADLLHVALQALGHVVVDHPSHVRFIQPHPKGHRGHHDAEVAAHEAGLDAAALGGREAGVVGIGQLRWGPVLEAPLA